MNKTNKKIKKGKLPNGWYVLPSKSYPHLVYYYNVLSNTSTWECPVTLPSSSDDETEDKSSEDGSDRRVTSTSVNDDFYPKTPAARFGRTSDSDDEPLTPDTNKNSMSSFSTFLFPSHSSDQDKKIYKKLPKEKEEPLRSKDVSKSSQNNIIVNGTNTVSKVTCDERVTNSINKEPKMSDYLPSVNKTVPSDIKCDLKSKGKKISVWQRETVRSRSENTRVILKRNTNIDKTSNTTDKQGKALLGAVLEKGPTVNNSFSKEKTNQGGLPRKNLAENRMKALKRSLNEKNKITTSSPTDLKQSSLGNCSVSSNYTNNPEPLMKKILTDKESGRIGAVPNTQNGICSAEKPCQPITENYSDEEMEWENIEVNDILMDVHELRDQIQQAGGLNINDVEEIKFEHNVNNQSKDPALFAVIDTNIFLTHLNFLEEFRDTSIEGYGYPVLVIPWMVLQELDILKDRRGVTKNPATAKMARRAIRFLHSNFHSHHPRVIGQTLPVVGSQLLMKQCPDDSVLECCLQYKSAEKTVILVSNDINLCNKAEVNGINAYSRDELGNEIQKMKSNNGYGCKSSEHGNTNLITLGAKSFNSRTDSSSLDILFCKVKNILHDVFGKILQMEMEKIYDDKWMDVIHIKPPWTLPDILSCLMSHWIAVFGFIMSEHCFMLLKDLKLFINSASQERGYDHSLDKIECIIDNSIRIFQEISDPEYKSLVTEGEQNLRALKYTPKNKEKCTKETVAQPPVQEESSIQMECSGEVNLLEVAANNVQTSLKHFLDTINTLCNNIEIMLQPNERPVNFPPEKNVETLISYFYPIVEQFCYYCERVIAADLGLLSIQNDDIQGMCSVFAKCNETRPELNITSTDLLFFLKTVYAKTTFAAAANALQKFAEIMRRGVDYFVSKDEASRQMF